jgi:hypothetical protein
MPTKLELKKEAKKLGYVTRIEDLGFKLGPSGLWFYRVRGEFIDVIDFWMKSSMKWVEIPVICFIKSEVSHCDISKFPKGFTNNMSATSNMFAGRDGFEVLGRPWKVSDAESIETTFQNLFELLKNDVVPWFNTLDTQAKVMESNA